MPVWVSLLRAVNLGARNQVNMSRLREALTANGFRDVRSYVQSGNLVTSSGHRSPERVAAAVRDVVREHFGVDTPVVVRAPTALAAVLRWCPFPDDVAADPARVHVLHLAADPAADQVEALSGTDWGEDALAVRGREVVVRYATNMHASRLRHGLVLQRLGVEGTARNWRTLTALVDLAGLSDPSG